MRNHSDIQEQQDGNRQDVADENAMLKAKSKQTITRCSVQLRRYSHDKENCILTISQSGLPNIPADSVTISISDAEKMAKVFGMEIQPAWTQELIDKLIKLATDEMCFETRGYKK